MKTPIAEALSAEYEAQAERIAELEAALHAQAKAAFTAARGRT